MEYVVWSDGGVSEWWEKAGEKKRGELWS